MANNRPHINERLHTEFANKGRAAGMGILYDKYNEEKDIYTHSVHVNLPSDYLTDEERKALSGEVKIIKGVK